MKHPKNQHYVPRLYLKQFAAERRAKNPPIYSFDKTTQRVHRPSVRNVAAELHFYERGDHGVEKWLSDVETEFVLPYRRLLQLDSLGELSIQEVAAVVLFLAVQFVRTREHREGIKSIGVAIRDMLDREGADYDPEWGDVSEDTLRLQQVAMLPDLAIKCMESMVDLKWVLFVNQTPMPLWTSDHPVTLHNERDNGGLRGNLGLKCRDIELHFPLSPLRSLCLCDPKDYGGREPLTIVMQDAQPVMFLNSLQVVSSTRFVFSNAADFTMAREIVTKHPHYANPTRPRVQAN